MKKKLYISIISAMVVTGLLCATSLAGFALTATKKSTEGPTVTLEKKAETAVHFTFNRDDADLFDNFKGLVPGGEVTQKIVVRNSVKDMSGGSTFNIFLYAENAGAEKLDGKGTAPADLFEKVHLSVSQNGEEKSLEKTGKDSKGTFLGNFSYDDATELTVTIKLPKELGNEYQNCKGNINWYFYAEQAPDEDIPDDDTPLTPPPAPKPTPKTPEFETIEDDEVPLQSLPKTGDESKIALFKITAAASAAVLIFLNTIRIINKRKSKVN